MPSCCICKNKKINECNDQIVPIPIQRDNCSESFWLRKEIPVNSAKMQDFVQPLLSPHNMAPQIWHFTYVTLNMTFLRPFLPPSACSEQESVKLFFLSSPINVLEFFAMQIEQIWLFWSWDTTAVTTFTKKHNNVNAPIQCPLRYFQNSYTYKMMILRLKLSVNYTVIYRLNYFKQYFTNKRSIIKMFRGGHMCVE